MLIMEGERKSDAWRYDTNLEDKSLRKEKSEAKVGKFTNVIRDRPRKAVRPLVLLWFHVEAQGGRRVRTYRRKR